MREIWNILQRRRKRRFTFTKTWTDQSQWPPGLRCGSVADRLLGLRVRIPPGALMSCLVNIVCWQVEVSATDRSLVQRSRTECGVCLNVNSKRKKWGGLGPLGLSSYKERYEPRNNFCEWFLEARSISCIFIRNKLMQKFYKFTISFCYFILVCDLVSHSKKRIPYTEYTKASFDTRNIKKTLEKFAQWLIQ